MNRKKILVSLLYAPIFLLSGCSNISGLNITNNRALITSISFSPDQEKIFYTLQVSPKIGNGSSENSNWVYNLKTKENRYINKTFYTNFPFWSDNQNINYSSKNSVNSNEELVSVNVDSKQEKQLFKSSGNIYSKDIKNNLFYFAENNFIKSIDPKNNSKKDILELKDTDTISHIKLSADGKKMLIDAQAYSDNSNLCKSEGNTNNFTIKTSLPEPICNFLYLFNDESKNIKKIYKPNFSNVLDSLEFSSDSKYIGFIDYNPSTINVLDSDSGETIYNKKLETQPTGFKWIDRARYFVLANI